MASSPRRAVVSVARRRGRRVRRAGRRRVRDAGRRAADRRLVQVVAAGRRGGLAARVVVGVCVVGKGNGESRRCVHFKTINIYQIIYLLSVKKCFFFSLNAVESLT